MVESILYEGTIALGTSMDSRKSHRSCIVNRQIGIGDSENVIVFDPLLTGLVIRRMLSGRVRIFYGNQWEPL